MSKELKIGLFAVSIAVASFFLINYLRGKDLLNREFELTSVYDNAEGLLPSAPVYIKGYKAGRVSDVVYDAGAGTFSVICSISKEFIIPSDSRMMIYSVDIMGGKGVRIDLGSSEQPAKDGDLLQAGYEPGLMDALSGGMGPLLSKVNNTLDSLAVTVGGVNRLLSEANVHSISNTLAHLERTMGDIEAVAAAAGGRTEEISAFLADLSVLSSSLCEVVEKADTTMATISDVAVRISESDLEGMVRSFRNLLDNINDPTGSIGRLFVDDSVYNSLDEILKDIDSLISKIEENPKKYLRISVF